MTRHSRRVGRKGTKSARGIYGLLTRSLRFQRKAMLKMIWTIQLSILRQTKAMRWILKDNHRLRTSLRWRVHLRTWNTKLPRTETIRRKSKSSIFLHSTYSKVVLTSRVFPCQFTCAMSLTRRLKLSVLLGLKSQLNSKGIVWLAQPGQKNQAGLPQ